MSELSKTPADVVSFQMGDSDVGLTTEVGGYHLKYAKNQRQDGLSLGVDDIDALSAERGGFTMRELLFGNNTEVDWNKVLNGSTLGSGETVGMDPEDWKAVLEISDKSWKDLTEGFVQGMKAGENSIGDFEPLFENDAEIQALLEESRDGGDFVAEVWKFLTEGTDVKWEDLESEELGVKVDEDEILFGTWGLTKAEVESPYGDEQPQNLAFTSDTGPAK